MTTQSRTAPFVGPRSIAYGEPIYGRDREIEAVTNTLVSQRIVLLYSPSGAGKSSLLEAGVRHRLEERSFHVLPTVRLSHVLDADTSNRYLMSTKLSISDAISPDERWSQERVAETSLGDFIDRVVAETALPEHDPCLVFDQFEELFTLDSADWDEKRAFLTELGIALRQRSRWALFAMREDYIAQLDPLLSLIPTRLAARYRLDLLEPDAARLAMIRPAEEAGVEFVPKAADHLLDDLRRTRVSRAGQTLTVPGRYVEPVVLQVVCCRLWEASEARKRIDVDDVEALGDVDKALADFCDVCIARAAATSGVSEHRIRDWIERELITDESFRSQTVSGPDGDGDGVLRALEAGHLLRAESRRGTTWYEIPHDRLVAPIRASTQRWFEDCLDPLQTAAREWAAHDRDDDRMLRGVLLQNAERWLADNPDKALPIDHEFVDASRAEQVRLADEKARAKRDRRRALLIAALAIVSAGLVLAIGLATTASEREKAADAKAEAADARARAAELAEDEALDERQIAQERATAAATEAEKSQETAEQLSAEATEAADAAMRAQTALEAAQVALRSAEQALADVLDDSADRDAVEQAAFDATTAADAADKAQQDAEEATRAADAARDAADEEADRRQVEADAAAASAAWNGEYSSEPDLPDIEVRVGDQGPTVGWLQHRLRRSWLQPELRSADVPLSPDCSFGRATEEAVKAVQAAGGVAVTGVADQGLWGLLEVDPAATTRPFSCIDENPTDANGDPCQRAHPIQGVALIVANIPDGDRDGGLNFRNAPELESSVIYPAANGTRFTSTGQCRIGPRGTHWWQLTDDDDTTGWAGSGFLFLDR